MTRCLMSSPTCWRWRKASKTLSIHCFLLSDFDEVENASSFQKRETNYETNQIPLPQEEMDVRMSSTGNAKYFFGTEAVWMQMKKKINYLAGDWIDHLWGERKKKKKVFCAKMSLKHFWHISFSSGVSSHFHMSFNLCTFTKDMWSRYVNHVVLLGHSKSF